MKLSVEIYGETRQDLDDALRVVRQQVRDGYLSGADSNDVGQYSYEIKDEGE